MTAEAVSVFILSYRVRDKASLAAWVGLAARLMVSRGQLNGNYSPDRGTTRQAFARRWRACCRGSFKQRVRSIRSRFTERSYAGPGPGPFPSLRPLLLGVAPILNYNCTATGATN